MTDYASGGITFDPDRTVFDSPASPLEERFILLREPNSIVAEAYRSLRAQLSRHLAKSRKCFLIMSPWAGDGKSMVCTNLAVSLTQLHLKVLLVDGDLRKPTLTRIFEMEDLTGFGDLLERGGDAMAHCHLSSLDNLYVCPQGNAQRNAANLLGRDHLATAFGQMREMFDCIIVDTPPLSACSDALLIGGQTDGGLLVVNPKSWNGEVERRLKDQVLDHGIPIHGVIANGVELTSGDGYGYGYGYGYGDTPPRKK